MSTIHTRAATPRHCSPENKGAQDISIYDLGFEIPDIQLEKIGFGTSNIHTGEANAKVRSSKFNNVLKKAGNSALAMGIFAGSFVAGNLLLSEKAST